MRGVWQRHGLETFRKGLVAAGAEGGDRWPHPDLIPEGACVDVRQAKRLPGLGTVGGVGNGSGMTRKRPARSKLSTRAIWALRIPFYVGTLKGVGRVKNRTGRLT